MLLTQCKRFFWFLKSLFTKPVYKNEVESSITKLRKKLQSIEPYDFKYSQSSDLTLFSLQSLYSSIVEYTEVLKTVNEALTFNTVLLRINYEQVLKTIYLNQFFLDKKGFYLDDDVKSMEEFIQEGTKFLSLYEACDVKRLDEPTMDHNLRLTNGILLNLFVLTESFSDVKNR